jgi:hypothetical protein
VNFFSVAEAEVDIFHPPFFYRSPKGRIYVPNSAGEPAHGSLGWGLLGDLGFIA